MPKPARQIDACPHTDRKHYSGGRCKSCYYSHRQELGLASRAAADSAYDSSEAGRERMNRYNQTEAGRARKRRWKNKQTRKPDATEPT